MDRNKNCFACNIRLDKGIDKKNRNVCKSCYKRKERKNYNNTSQNNRKSEVVITKTLTIEPQTSNEILEVLESRSPRSPKTLKSSNLEVLEPRSP